MRRSALQFLVALGVVIASAMLDGGPRANAAYIPTVGRMEQEPARLGSSCGASEVDPDWVVKMAQRSKENFDRFQADLTRNSSTTGSSPQLSGSDYPSSGLAGVPELPPPAQVHYLRLATERLELSAYVDSILDPPRMI